jgi:hypothetical protein
MLIRYQDKPDIWNSCGIDKNSMEDWELYLGEVF